jgi:hypothetical protein
MSEPPRIPPPIPSPRLTTREIQELAYAKSLLENPGLTARLSNLLGTPIEKGLKLLPQGWSDAVNKASRAALLKALQLAIVTMRTRKPGKASERFHKLLVGASGGIGGAFGLAALAVELPISTTIMLRSIADIARSEGHDARAVGTKLACLEVFALGGRSPADDATESSYWAVRAALAKAISEAASYIAEKGVLEKSAPAVVRLIGSIASRFGVVVSEQVAAKAVPIVGAAGGSIINVLFMNHFQDMARGHFIVKRLEQRYGIELVRATYESLAVPLR